MEAVENFTEISEFSMEFGKAFTSFYSKTQQRTIWDRVKGRGHPRCLYLMALNHTECGLTNQRIMGAPFVFHAIPRPASRIVIFRVNIEEASNVRIAFFYGKAFPCSRSIAHSYINVGSAHLPLGKIKTTHCRTK